MPSQISTKHASVSHHHKPETTPLRPPPSQAHVSMLLSSPSWSSAASVSHTRRRHHHPQVCLDLAAGPSSMPTSFWTSADSSSQVGLFSSSPTSSWSDSYASSASIPTDSSGLGTPSGSKRTPSPKSMGEAISSPPSSKPTSHEAVTVRGPPCNNCHKPSTLCTVGPLNPKGNVGKKYFACRQCPFGLGWVGWADRFFDGVLVEIERDNGVGSVTGAESEGGDGVDRNCGKIHPEASGEGLLFGVNAGERTEGLSLESQAADESKPTCCCGECMRLEYVDLGWEATHGVPGEGRKKWFWTCAHGGCEKFVWVEDTGGLAIDDEIGTSRMRPEDLIRILW